MILIPPLFLFYLPFALAYWRVTSVNSNTPKIGLGLFIGSLILLAFMFLIIRGPGSAFGMVGLTLAFVFPPLFIGSGIGLGAKAKVYALQGFKRRSQLVVWGPLVIFTVLIGWLTYYSLQEQKILTEKRTAYQSLTIEEKLGSNILNIPISPQIVLHHRCNNLMESKAVLKKCHAGEYPTDFRSRNLSARSATAPQLKNIRILGKRSKVFKNFKSNYYSAPDAEIETWCQGRAELKDAVWCNNELGNFLRYKEYFAPSEFSAKMNARDWVTILGEAVGSDYAGQPVYIECSTVRDQVNENNRLEGRRELNRLCRVKFRLEEKVQVEGSFFADNDMDGVSKGRDSVRHAKAFWDDMKTRK